MLTLECGTWVRSSRSNYKWTTRQDDILRDAFEAGAGGDAMTAAVNEQTGSSYTRAAVLSHAAQMGLRRPGKRPPVVWTDDMNTELQERIDATDTLSQIADSLSISYGAVVKQVHRLNIKVPQGHRRTTAEQVFHRQVQTDKATARDQERRLRKLLNWVPGEYRQEGALPDTPDPVTNPRNLTLDQVRSFDCHWISNNDLTDPRYCGHDVVAGTSWCPAHKKLVTRDPATFTPPPPYLRRRGGGSNVPIGPS